MYNGIASLESNLTVSKKVEHRFTIWPGNSTLNMKTYVHTKTSMPVFITVVIIYNNWKVWTNRMWLDKQTVVYPYYGIRLSNKKRQTTNTCYSTDEPQKHYAFLKELRGKRPHMV